MDIFVLETPFQGRGGTRACQAEFTREVPPAVPASFAGLLPVSAARDLADPASVTVAS